MTSPIRVAVVEDEELQRKQLTSWLGAETGVEVVGEAADGLGAIRMIDTLRPDLVLLDVSLPELSGIDVLQRLTHVPDVVFTTAFRDHAVAAFELGAVDYLLKPFGAARLSEALRRVRERGRDDAALRERVASVHDDRLPLERLFVRDRGAIVPVPVDTIVRLETDGDYTAVVTATRRHLVAIPLTALHERIRRPDFVRVHRQHVVNLAKVVKLVPHDAARLRVECEGGGSVIASKAGSQTLRGLVE